MPSFLISPGRLFLALEALALFVALPVLLATRPSHLTVLAGLWVVCAYAGAILHLTPGFSWREAWRGMRWKRRDLYVVIARFLVSTIGIILLTWQMQPHRLFSFPRERPAFWLLIMLLYPLLSALPQELAFRVFFLRRYAPLFPRQAALVLASSLAFGFVHIVFHNWVSPLLSFICGFFLCSSYLAHRSLKRVALEHALYGDMVFTVGLGLYFVLGH